MQEFTEEELKTEEWRDVVGYEGKYQVSDLGRVKSNRKGSVLSDLPSKNGRKYRNVCLFLSGTVKRLYVHRLVAKAFLPNPYNKPCVNHKNLDKFDCRVLNLEWCTKKENVRHAIKNGVASPPPNCNKGKFGGLHHNSKSVIQMDLNENIINTFDSISCAARFLNTNKGNISDCLNKVRNRVTCRGFKWRYAG